jgi:hypothetical protein
MEKIILHSHEGCISDTLEIEIFGEIKAVKNEMGNWKLLKELADLGNKVVVHYKKWSGEVIESDWVGSPSYTCRFK